MAHCRNTMLHIRGQKSDQRRDACDLFGTQSMHHLCLPGKLWAAGKKSSAKCQTKTP